PGSMDGPGRKPDKRWNVAMDRPLEPRDDGPQAGPAPLCPAYDILVPGQTLPRGVLSPGTYQGPDDHKLAHHLRQPRHVLADPQALDIGSNWLEVAPYPRRCLRFEVEHILMRRSSGQEDHDDRFVRSRDPRGRLGAEQLWHRQPPQGQSAELEKIA